MTDQSDPTLQVADVLNDRAQMLNIAVDAVTKARTRAPDTFSEPGGPIGTWKRGGILSVTLSGLRSVS